MAKELRFTPRLFDFLRELKANNRREWFDPNKQRYIDDVRDPMLAFIAAIGPRLGDVSPYLVADPKRSMFRIYRDTRFSKDKTPYKTVASAFFFHQDAGKEGAGVYLHLEPASESSSCFLGIGSWHPDPATRTKISDAIAKKTDAWRDAVSGKEFRKLFKMEGDSLAKLPKQYDPQHPFVEDLKRKDFIVVSYFSEKQACARDFIDRVDHLTHVAAPYLGFIIKAVGLKW
ncbi:MAG: DUF2461 domain-containing protein [Blastocatellia bacterium]